MEAKTPPARWEAEAGSFRDRESRVFYRDGEVLRALSPRAAEAWRALRATELFTRRTADGTLVGTEEIGAEATPDAGFETVLRHERIPFVSYPYEWTFGMLRAGALLTLDLLLEALEEGLTLKDASAYNVQWRGARPVFVDVGSFEPATPGEPWTGYRQFCMLFLYPLMLQAWRGVDFRPWLRGSLEGIAPGDMARLLRGRDRLRRGVTTHVHLHARLERRYAAAGGEVRRQVKASGFSDELIKANARKLRRIIDRMQWASGETAWTGYREDNTYDDADARRKADFVRAAAGARRPALTWDLGCNDGAFSRAAAEAGGGTVVATDLDHATVERLYASLRAEDPLGDRILPLVVDLADPSPGLGWRGRERRTLEDRGRPDLVLALALVHHLSITANVPVTALVGWFASLGGSLVVEWVDPEDPQAQRLLARKGPASHPDYERGHFERRLGEAFEIERREELGSGTRVLYLVHPRA